MPKAVLQIETGKNAKDYIDIIEKEIHYKRSNVTISGRGADISIKVEAADLTALIASMGSVLRQLRIVEDAEEMISKQGKAGNKNKKVQR